MVHATIAIQYYPSVKIANRRSTASRERGTRGYPYERFEEVYKADGRGVIDRGGWRVASCSMLFGGAGEHGFHLGLQRRGVERLDDVIVDAGFLRGDDVFGLRFRGDHDEGRI